MKFLLTLVVWGDWHLGQLEAHGLPSLRASGNLDAIDYQISAYTRPADLRRLLSLLDGLRAHTEIEFSDDIKGDQASADEALRKCYMKDRTSAAKRGYAWAQLAPDMVWGDGTFSHHRSAFDRGKKVVIRPLLRTDATEAGTIHQFNKRHLASIALRCEHKTSKVNYRADARAFSAHPEMIIWDAPDGLLNQTITASVQACMPRSVLLDAHGLPQSLPDNEMEIVTDSDDAISLAMTPTKKDFLFCGNAPLDADAVRDFLKRYPSPASKHIAQSPYRLHAGDINCAAWFAIEQKAKDFATEVFH